MIYLILLLSFISICSCQVETKNSPQSLPQPLPVKEAQKPYHHIQKWDSLATIQKWDKYGYFYKVIKFKFDKSYKVYELNAGILEELATYLLYKEELYTHNLKLSTSFKQRVDIYDLGEVDVYKLEYVGEGGLPTALHCFIPIAETEKSVTFFPFEDCVFIKVNPQSNKVFFAGIYGMMSNGFLDLFSYEKGYPKNMLSTSSICDSVAKFSDIIPVVFHYDENNCDLIKNNRLDIDNIDLNNDGLLDIRLSGYKIQYCPPKPPPSPPARLRNMYLRNAADSIALDTVPIAVDIIVYQNKNKKYRWGFKDKNNICGTLNYY